MKSTWEKILRKGFGEGNYWNLVEINADIVLRLKTRKTDVKLGLFLLSAKKRGLGKLNPFIHRENYMIMNFCRTN